MFEGMKVFFKDVGAKRSNRSSQRPGQALRPGLVPPHPGAAGGCAQGLSPSLPHEEVVTAFVWVLLVNAVEAGDQCVTLGLPQLPPLPVGMGRLRSSMGLLPWGDKGGYPHAMQEIWNLPELRDEFQSLRQEPDKLLLLLSFLLPLSFLTLWLDK